MRQEREPVIFSIEQGDVNPLRWSSDNAVGVSRLDGSSKVGERLEEIRFGLQQESNNHRKEGKDSIETHDQRSDGFEPFLNPEFREGDLFVNNYGGNFAHAMELNRGGVKRVLEIAHLNGTVSLTNLQPSRSRVDMQGNELAAKRFLIFDRKTQKTEEENTYKRVVSAPEGWRIEINDSRITDELTERQLSGKELQRTFINMFNGQFKDALKECVWREKCSSEKDKDFRRKLFFSSVNPTAGLIFSAQDKFDPAQVAYQMGIVLFVFTLSNIFYRLPFIAPFSLGRNIYHPLEYFMPQVEIDKVGRTFAYLAGKGRTLVRDVEEKQ